MAVHRECFVALFALELELPMDAHHVMVEIALGLGADAADGARKSVGGVVDFHVLLQDHLQ